MNIVHLVVVKNSFYNSESGRTIRKSAHFSLILGTKNLVKIGTQQVVSFQPLQVGILSRTRVVSFQPLQVGILSSPKAVSTAKLVVKDTIQVVFN